MSTETNLNPFGQYTNEGHCNVEGRIFDGQQLSIFYPPHTETDILYCAEECYHFLENLDKSDRIHPLQFEMLDLWRELGRPHPAKLRLRLVLDRVTSGASVDFCQWSWDIFQLHLSANAETMHDMKGTK